MSAFRKIVGLLIILLFGLPLIFGVIWTVGITQGAVSAEFLSDLPQKIIADIPEMVDEIYEDAQKENVIKDRATRTWFQAASKVQTSPRELMERTGLLNWIEGELSASLHEIGEILRGKTEVHPIMINLQPLKNALMSEEIDVYLKDVVSYLPPCTEEDALLWNQTYRGDIREMKIPPCQPDPEILDDFLRDERVREIRNMPDDVKVFEGIHSFPFGITKTLSLFSYLLFLIPGFFLFLGALIAGGSVRGFFRWFGISIFIGGIICLGLAFFAKTASPIAVNLPSMTTYEGWSGELSELTLDKTGWIFTSIINQLFSPVITVSVIVCLVGLVLFLLSFAFKKPERSRPVKQEPAQSPPKTEESTSKEQSA
jgi:hypothetical protein